MSIKKVDCKNLALLCYKRDVFCDDFIANAHATFQEYLHTYLYEDGKDDLRNHVITRLKIKKFPNVSDEDMLQMILPVTIAEEEHRISDKNFFFYSSKCCLDMLESVFTEELYHKIFDVDDRLSNAIGHNYYTLLHNILLDLNEILNLYDIKFNGCNEILPIRSNWIHSMQIHQVLRQSIYGQYSYSSFSDLHIQPSAGIIRQLVELRIRRAFSLIGIIDESNNSISPISMGDIFKVLKTHKNEIKFPGRIDIYERIYSWSNWYIHCGKHNYTWIYVFLEKFLKAFSMGKIDSSGNWSYDNGIEITQMAFDAIHDEILNLFISKLKECSDKNRYSFVNCRAECTIITAEMES